MHAVAQEVVRVADLAHEVRDALRRGFSLVDDDIRDVDQLLFHGDAFPLAGAAPCRAPRR